jgi:DNA-binding transcriptional regulator GbsR (MarR family)
MPTRHSTPADVVQAVQREFVDLWGSMSSLWGVSPAMARIHGLLFLTGESLTADEIMERLGISRGNVSMNVGRLLEWGLIRRVRRPGDRREYYETSGDVWEMFTTVAAQRKRREIDPLLHTLRRCEERLAAQVTGDTSTPDDLHHQRQRIQDLVRVLSLMDSLSQRFFESRKSLRAAIDLLTSESSMDTQLRP